MVLVVSWWTLTQIELDQAPCATLSLPYLEIFTFATNDPLHVCDTCYSLDCINHFWKCVLARNQRLIGVPFAAPLPGNFIKFDVFHDGEHGEISFCGEEKKLFGKPQEIVWQSHAQQLRAHLLRICTVAARILISYRTYIIFRLQKSDRYF